MTEAAWAALTLTLTLVGALYTFWAFRRRGAAAGTRGAALTLLPIAAYLTGTLQMFTEITSSVADWATSLVFSPVVWAGIGTFGMAVVLLLVSGRLQARAAGTSAGTGKAKPAPAAGAAPRSGALPSAGARKPVVDEDDDGMDDIEKILRRHGIT